MAQSGYTPILIYASGTASNVPLAANLTSSASGAELALNYADGKLYFKNSSGVVTLLAGSGGGGPAAGSNTQIQFNNSGVFGASANLTWDGTVLSTTGLTATGAITLNTTTNNQSYTTTGAGTITISSGTAGSINNMNIGATTAGTGKFTAITNSALTSGRVVYSTTGGLETDSAGLTFDGTNLSVGGSISSTIASKTAQFNAAGGSIYASFADGTKTWRFGAGIQSAGTVSLYNATDAVTAYTVDATGNVGIGTSSPTGISSYPTVDVKGTSGGAIRVGSATYQSYIYTDAAGMTIGTATGQGVNFFTNGTQKAAIDSSGNVGIGTSSPGVKLDVSGVIRSTGTGAILSFSKRSTGTGDAWGMYSQSGEYNIYDYTAGVSRLVIDTSGNVGIGTSSPSYKLDVANSDAQVYGVRVGRGAGAISTNTVLGNSVLPSNSTGSSNTAIGYRAGNPITTGISNTFLGPDTGYGLQSSASYNTVLGAYALNASASVGPTGAVVVGYSAGYYLKNADYSVVIGYQAGAFGGFYQTYSTVAIGYQASQYNYGAYNTVIGYQANYGSAVNSNSFNITAVGHSALFSNTASYNAAFGNVAGFSNTSGTNNTFIGSGAAYSGTTGSDNTALGLSSLYSNQTNSNITSIGSQAQYYMRADGNTSIGYQSLYGSATPANNTGGYNTVIGYRAVFNTLTTGAYNTVIGASAGYSLTTGSQNVLIGSSSTASTAAGYAITTGQYNVVIGPYTGNSGGLDIRTASNFVVFADGQSNIRQVFNSSGVSLTAQGAPASITTTATLTGAQVLGGLINTTGTTYTVTMPLGTSLDTALVGCPTDFAFNFSVINTASGTITMAVNTGITSLGSLSISTGTSATYRVRKTAANTFVMYRI